MKVLKFGAVWCADCLVMKPMWERIEAKLPKLETEFYDADEHPDVLQQYNVSDIPVFIFLDKEGNEFERKKGVQNEEELFDFVKNNLDK